MKFTLHFFSCQRRQAPEPRLPVISAPFMFRREETAEVKSILEAFNTQLPGGLPPALDLNSLGPNSAIKQSTGAQSPRHFDNSDMNLPSTHQHLRSTLSSPELRTPTSNSMSHNLPAIPLCAVSSRHSESYPADRPKSWFSIRTEFIEGRRTAVRKVLDTIGCTKGDQFDVRDFKRVRAPTIQALRTTISRTSIHNRRPSLVSFTQFITPLPTIVVSPTKS